MSSHATAIMARSRRAAVCLEAIALMRGPVISSSGCSTAGSCSVKLWNAFLHLPALYCAPCRVCGTRASTGYVPNFGLKLSWAKGTLLRIK